MGMADKVRGGDGRRTIASVEMRENGDNGNIYILIWIKHQRIRVTGDIRDAGQ